MGSGSTRRVARLRARMRARSQRCRVDVARDTVLPANLFDCQEPMVEAALIDAAARVFLEKLGQTDKLGQTTGGNSPEANPPPPPSAEVVDQAAIDACVRAFRGLDDGKPPALMRDLDDERVWVLLDIARHGTGWSRQRATSELRDSLRALSEQPRGKGKLLGSLLRQLRSAVSAGFPVVFRALLLETEVGLRRLRDPKAPRVTQ